MIPYGCQSIGQEEINAVKAVLESDWLTQGPKVSEFEQALSDYCSVPHSIACANGTAALHLACLSLDVSSGDIVWTSPISFVASSNCALVCGASVDFVDIHPSTRNLCPDALAKKLAQAKKKKALPKVVIAVHFAGYPCDMQAIYNLSREYGFYIIEDAAHAIGSSYMGSTIGGCRFSHITTFSFHPVKNMTSGEGGAITTKDEKLAYRLRQLCAHGVTRDKNLLENSTEGDWYYEQQMLGLNYRMSDIHAALGIVQLQKLPVFVSRRNAVVQRYHEQIAQLPVEAFTPSDTSVCEVAWHLFVIQLERGIDRKKVFDTLRGMGIGVNVHYYPIHLQPYYRKLGFKPKMFPNAECYYQQALTLPLFPGLSPADQAYIIEQLDKAISSVSC